MDLPAPLGPVTVRPARPGPGPSALRTGTGGCLKPRRRGRSRETARSSAGQQQLAGAANGPGPGGRDEARHPHAGGDQHLAGLGEHLVRPPVQQHGAGSRRGARLEDHDPVHQVLPDGHPVLHHHKRGAGLVQAAAHGVAHFQHARRGPGWRWARPAGSVPAAWPGCRPAPAAVSARRRGPTWGGPAAGPRARRRPAPRGRAARSRPRGTARFSAPKATSSPRRESTTWVSGSCCIRPARPRARAAARRRSAVSRPRRFVALPSSCPQHPGQGVQQRGFSGPGGAQQQHPFPGPDVQVQPWTAGLAGRHGASPSPGRRPRRAARRGGTAVVSCRHQEKTAPSLPCGTRRSSARRSWPGRGWPPRTGPRQSPRRRWR